MNYLFESGPYKISYCIQRTTRKHSVGIQVLPNASVLLRIPKRFSEKKLDEIIHKRADWILEKQNYFKENLITYSLHHGAELPYLGQTIVLQIQQAKTSKREVFFNGKELKVLLKDGDKVEEYLKKEILKWYYSQAREKIIESIYRFQLHFNVSPKKITIRNQKQRWGSCNNKRYLNFNWRLILLPSTVLDYVVLHEMSHLLHLNHSFQFWNKVESIMPDYAQNRRWLKQKTAEYFSFL